MRGFGTRPRYVPTALQLLATPDCQRLGNGRGNQRTFYPLAPRKVPKTANRIMRPKRDSQPYRSSHLFGAGPADEENSRRGGMDEASERLTSTSGVQIARHFDMMIKDVFIYGG